MDFSDTSLLSSPGAQALSALIKDIALNWTSKIDTHDKVDIVFGTLQRIMTLAISEVATAWNATHDAIRVLPPEVQEACFSPLSVPDKARLSLVCSHWCSNLARLHGIWSSLTVQTSNTPLDVLLARSGQLPLNLVIANSMSMIELDNFIIPHARRLRSLDVVLTLSSSDVVPVLHYPAPLLEQLSLESRYRRPFSFFHMSERNAPRLRTLSLTFVLIPSVGVVLGQVTTLSVAKSDFSMEHLHQSFPALEHLRIDDCWVDLPYLPACAPLRTLEVRYSSVSVKSLVEHGYARLERLTVLSYHEYDIISTASLFPEFPSTLHQGARHETTFTLRPGNCTLQFFVCPRDISVTQDLLCRHSTDLRSLKSLTLPASVCPEMFFGGYTILLADAVAHLPALRTITIECRQRWKVTIFDCVKGTIRPPALERVEVVAAASALYAEHVDAGRLAAFITDTLVCDDRGALELFVDPTHGMLLDGDLNTLRACVGKLII